MKTSSKIILIVFFSSTFVPSNAQEQTGQLTLNAGVGYSPLFNGGTYFISSLLYPVSYNMRYTEEVYFSSVSPNLGARIDYTLPGRIIVGLAVNNQSEVVTTNNGAPIINNITRTNIGARVLYHLNKDNTSFDNYLGMRVGFSFWTDATPNLPSTTPYYNDLIFLNSSNLAVPSVQFLYGIIFYPGYNVGLHIEVGIGSPYTAEAGLTCRINTRKPKDK